MTERRLDPTRRIACARCGATFACRPGGACWCTTEPYRLPVPDSGAEDCLCPICLRQAAAMPSSSFRDGT